MTYTELFKKILGYAKKFAEVCVTLLQKGKERFVVWYRSDSIQKISVIQNKFYIILYANVLITALSLGIILAQGMAISGLRFIVEKQEEDIKALKQNWDVFENMAWTKVDGVVTTNMIKFNKDEKK